MAASLRSQVMPTYRCCCSTLSSPYLALRPTSSAQTQRSFSTTPAPPMPRSRTPRRLPRDRGASALRRKPYPYMMSVGREELPEPVMDPDLKTELTTSEDHPLWAFFNPQKTVLSTPVEDHKHGRAWTVDELRRKSWEDLHKLWWVCVKERNLMATQELERRRIKPGYGDKEAYAKEMAVKTTQRGIKHALTERYYAWQEALEVAEKDPEVNLSGRGAVYSPKAFEDDDVFVGDEEVAATPEGSGGTVRLGGPPAEPSEPAEPRTKDAPEQDLGDVVQYPPVQPGKKDDKVTV